MTTRFLGEYGKPVPGLLDVNQPDYPTMLARAMGTQNTVPGRMDPLISAGVTVDDYTLPEFWWLRRGMQGLWTGIQAAVAAQFGWVGIQGAPGVLTVCERIIIANEGAVVLNAEVGLNTTTPSGGAYFAAGCRDSRNGLGFQTATTGATRAAGALVAPFFPVKVSIPVGSTVVLEVPWVLTGAVFLSAQSRVLNTPIAASFQFRERALLPQEA